MAGYWPFSAPDAGWSEIDNGVEVEFISVVETYFLGSCSKLNRSLVGRGPH